MSDMTDHILYDPRGTVTTAVKPLAPRVAGLVGLRLGVLDNTKWNAGKLLRRILDLLSAEVAMGMVTYYRKDTFSRPASDELIATIASQNDVVLTAIGD